MNCEERLVGFLTFLPCFCVFIYQMSFIWKQYLREEASVALESVSHDRLPMPAVTVCAEEAFKRELRDPPSEEEYISATFSKGELFPNGTVAGWNVSEVRSLYLGRCYIFTSDELVVAMNLSASIKTWQNVSAHVYGICPSLLNAISA